MYTIKLDLEKQCIYMFFEGHLEPDKAVEAVNYAISLMEKLSPGFTAIYDVSRLSLLAPGAGIQLRFLRKSLSNFGARLLVRISGNKVYEVTFRNHKEAVTTSYETRAAMSLEEALQIVKGQCSNN